MANVIREKLTDAECQAVYGKLIRTPSTVGEDAAIEMIGNVLGFLLWNKGIPATGPVIETAMAALRYGLQSHIKGLENSSQIAGANVH